MQWLIKQTSAIAVIVVARSRYCSSIFGTRGELCLISYQYNNVQWLHVSSNKNTQSLLIKDFPIIHLCTMNLSARETEVNSNRQLPVCRASLLQKPLSITEPCQSSGNDGCKLDVLTENNSISRINYNQWSMQKKY